MRITMRIHMADHVVSRPAKPGQGWVSGIGTVVVCRWSSIPTPSGKKVIGHVYEAPKTFTLQLQHTTL